MITITIDAHAHPWDGKDGYPTVEECINLYGLDSMREIPADDPDHPMPGWETWAYWYTVTGEIPNVRRWLIEEYGHDEISADEIIADAKPATTLTN